MTAGLNVTTIGNKRKAEMDDFDYESVIFAIIGVIGLIIVVTAGGAL
jgi:hypothetical protein